MSYFVTSDSWLAFDLIGIDSDWLLLPCELWDQSSNFHKLKQFFLNLSATNDGAEWAIALITKYMDKVQDEEGRQELIQCVDYWRKQVQDLSKDSLDNLL